MATQRDIKERRRIVKGLLEHFTRPADVSVTDRTVKADMKAVRENWFDDSDDYLFDIQREYNVLGEMLGAAKQKGEAALAASLSQQRSRLRKEKHQYERVQSGGLEGPGLSDTLAAALSDLNGSTAPE